MYDWELLKIRELDKRKSEVGTKLNDFRTRAFSQSDPLQQINRGVQGPCQLQFPRGCSSSLAEERHLAAEPINLDTLPQPEFSKLELDLGRTVTSSTTSL